MSDENGGFNLDKSIAWLAMGAYFVGVFLYLSPYQYLRAGLGAALLFGALIFVARLLDDRPIHGMEVLGVAFVTGAMLLFPEFPAEGGHSPAGLITGAFGTEAAVLLWAVYRWPEDQAAEEEKTSLSECLFWGAGMALFLSIIASIPILLAAASEVEGWTSMLLVYPGYFAGFLAAGLVYWLLQSISHYATGRYLVGVLCGSCVYGAVGPLLDMFDPGGMNTKDVIVAVVACGFLVGPAVALGWDNMVS